MSQSQKLTCPVLHQFVNEFSQRSTAASVVGARKARARNTTAVVKSLGKKVRVKGKVYPSKRAAAEALNLDRRSALLKG